MQLFNLKIVGGLAWVTLALMGSEALAAERQKVYKPDALLSIDLNRNAVVEKIVFAWSGELPAAQRDSFKTKLQGLRADHLLAANLSGSFEGVLEILSGHEAAQKLGPAPVAQAGAVANKSVEHGLAEKSKALGDATADLVYTPVTPCRLFDSRAGQTSALGNLGGVMTANVFRTVPAGGACGIPNSGVASIFLSFHSFNNNPSLLGIISFAKPGDGLTAMAGTWTGESWATGTFIAGTDITGAFQAFVGNPNPAMTAELVVDVTGYFMPPNRAGNGLRVIQTTGLSLDAPNVINGSANNSISLFETGSTTNSVQGATVSGGGAAGTHCTDRPTGSTRSCGNQATHDYATVGGGLANLVSSVGATVAGGLRNTASGYTAAVGGGSANTASGYAATVGGGDTSTALGTAATVGGGAFNIASGPESTVSGGRSNIANGSVATVGGGLSNATSGFGATVAGGESNTASGHRYATVGGGFGNTASGLGATVAGGSSNTASSFEATVAGGESNTASGFGATVAGGVFNIAGGDYSFAAGRSAKATHHGSFVWADSQNAEFNSTAVNEMSIRAAGGVRLNNDTGLFFGNQTRQMLNLLDAGYGIGVQAGTLYFRSAQDFCWYRGGSHADAACTPGAGGAEVMKLTSAGLVVNSVAITSDREKKQAFKTVDVKEVLKRVVSMPISSWVYKSSSDIRHIGPVAQDFRRLFGVGQDDKTIATVDADGVALAAIQGLNQKLVSESKAKDAKIAAQETKISTMERELAAIKKKLGL